jgi:hypothetical protein
VQRQPGSDRLPRTDGLVETRDGTTDDDRGSPAMLTCAVLSTTPAMS